MQMARSGLTVSPRRFTGWARAAVAYSMLKDEREMSPKALLIGRHILWISLEERDEVGNIVAQISDPERRILLTAAADLEEIQSRIESEHNVQALVGWRTKLTKHVRISEGKVRAPDLLAERQELLQRMQEAQARLIERAGEVIDQRDE